MRHSTRSALPILSIAILVLLLFAAIAHPVSAMQMAQTSVTFDSVVVDIWPEYDQPAVLVMYHIALSPEVKLPATLTVNIPSSAGQPHAVATKDVNGLYNLQYQTAPAGEWLQITFTTSMPEVRIEYYDPSLDKQQNQRSFIYRWLSTYPVKNMTIQVQQPGNATNMTFEPSMGSGRQAADNLTYYSLLAGQVNAEDEFDLKISYQKPDDSLTNADSLQEVLPVREVDDQTPGRITLNEVLPFLLGGLGVLLIAVGIWWYWRAGRMSQPVLSRMRHSARTRNTPAVADAKQSAYCHQCGKRAAPGDAFCRACGTKLR